MARKPGDPLVSAAAAPVDVSLTSKSIKSVPTSEKTPDTTHNGFSYARSLTADDIAYISTAPAMDLRERYAAEANSHRNRKADAKRSGKPFSPAISEFRDFLLLIGPMPAPGMTLDRIDNDGGYWCGRCDDCKSNEWPPNLRTATRKEQQRNRRNNVWVEYEGERRLLIELCEALGLDYKPTYKRIYELGWPVAEAVETPIGVRRKLHESPFSDN